MIEAMACGTPLVAFKAGSVSEIIDDEVSGVVVETNDRAVNAVLRLKTFDRATVRAAFEKRFRAERMALGYLDIYRSLPGVRGERCEIDGLMAVYRIRALSPKASVARQ